MEALEKSAPIVIRPAAATDWPYVYSSWLRSYWDGCVQYLQPVKPRTYYGEQHRLITRLAERPGAVLLVASAAEHADTILGWLVGERTDTGDLLHYVHVKAAFQGFGIARALLSEMGAGLATLTYTHTTKQWARIMRPYAEATFNPWRLP